MIQLYAAIWRVSGRRQIVLIFLSFAIAALAAAPLKFQQDIVNLLTYGPFEKSQLFLLGGGMMGVILVSLGLKWVMGYRSQLLGEDVIRLIRSRLLTGAADEKNRVAEFAPVLGRQQFRLRLKNSGNSPAEPFPNP